MTVSVTTRKITFPGSGTTGPFTFDFRVFATTDVDVYKISSAGVKTLLTVTTDYTITLTSNGLEGGSVTTVANVAVGETLLIEGDVPLQQLTDFSNQGSFFPENHETALDRLTINMQEMKLEVDRSLKFGNESSFSGLELPEPEASNVLGWNAAGDDIVNIPPSSESTAAAAASAAAAAASAASAASDAALFPSISGGDAKKHLRVNAGETAFESSNTLEDHTLKAVDDYYELIWDDAITEDEFFLTFSSDEAKTLTRIEGSSSAGGFTATVNVAGSGSGGSIVVSGSEQNDTTFTDASVAVGESLSIDITSLTGSPDNCWVRLHYQTDRVVNS